MDIYTAAITLLLIMDPFGNIPVFLSLLEPVAPRRRPLIIIRELTIALGVLLLFLFSGRIILARMQITESALNISAGVLLFIIALRMIFPQQATAHDEEGREEPLIVPLAVPLIAGPSAITIVVLFTTQAPEKIWVWFVALVSAWFVSTLVLLLAAPLRKMLGHRLLAAIERLMGMILTTLAVQMLLGGIRTFIDNDPENGAGLWPRVQ
jgi:multiple antibiotic resistance protein